MCKIPADTMEASERSAVSLKPTGQLNGTKPPFTARNVLNVIRRRIISDEDFYPDEDLAPGAQLPPREEAFAWWERRVDDLWLITRLAARLYAYLWFGVRWYFKFIRLVAFAVLLLPGFSQMIVFYFFSPRLLRSIPYGSKSRNRLDVYLPRRRWRRKGPCPVVIYVTGGAWTIGYKAWGALFGRRLSQRGVLVFCLDYRNFPQGKALDMLQDVNTGVKWVLGNAELYGGDAEQVFLIGQSAGGHLTSLAVLAQAMQASNGGAALGASPSWDLSRLRGYVGVSGAYDLVTLADHLHRRGLYQNMFGAIMAGPEGTPMLDKLSPSEVAARLSKEAATLVPPVLLLHGTADRSVPITNAEGYYQALVKAGVAAQMKSYVGKTHTQPIVEDPMRGGQDKLMDEVLSLIRGEECINRQFPMLPNVLIDAATFVCPF